MAKQTKSKKKKPFGLAALAKHGTRKAKKQQRDGLDGLDELDEMDIIGDAPDASAMDDFVEHYDAGSGKEEKQPEAPSLDVEAKQILKTFTDYNFTAEEIGPFLNSLRVPEYGAREVVRHWHEPDRHRKIKIGIISDTHLGHRDSDLNILRSIYERFKKEKVVAVYHAGDIIEGKVSSIITHPNERLVHSLDDQVQYLAENYPKVGINTYYLEGKFPQGFFKETGTNIGRKVLEKRPDLIYLAPFEADIRLSPKITMRLAHASQQAPYAISYYPQQEIASLSGGTKPNILVNGGLHYLYNIPDWRGVAVYLAGTTQRQTPHMRKTKRPAILGAFILEIEQYSDKRLKDIRTTVLPFY